MSLAGTAEISGASGLDGSRVEGRLWAPFCRVRGDASDGGGRQGAGGANGRTGNKSARVRP